VLDEDSCLIYVIYVCLRIVVSNTYLYLQVFVGGFMSYLRYMFVCLRIVVSNTYLYLQVFVGGFMSYLRYLSLFTYCA
jgi:methyl coenzyme M reductase alpha subunit